MRLAEAVADIMSGPQDSIRGPKGHGGGDLRYQRPGAKERPLARVLQDRWAMVSRLQGKVKQGPGAHYHKTLALLYQGPRNITRRTQSLYFIIHFACFWS